jgi:hypothetical protein
MSSPSQDLEDYINWLETTLIPDLKDSGNDATAEDFETCIEWLREFQPPLTTQSPPASDPAPSQSSSPPKH